MVQEVKGVQWKNDRAIFLQVVEYFKHQVILNNYLPGSKIASVREYALSLEINPNTVVKAYDILANQGIIEVRSTNGYFLTTDENILKKLKPSFAKEYQKTYLNSMKEIGYSKQEAIKMLEEEE